LNSRSKGKRGELQLSAVFREHGYECRRGQQFRGGGDSPDVTGHGLPIHVECKFTERLSIYDAIAQATRDAGELMPVVFHRKKHAGWLVTVTASDFFRMLNNLDLAALVNRAGEDKP
jgi:Holliday junction resolvase